MTVTINGNRVLADGIQVGASYSSHEAAINQGKKMRDKHYPASNFVIIPEPVFIPTTKTKKTKKTI